MEWDLGKYVHYIDEKKTCNVAHIHTCRHARVASYHYWLGPVSKNQSYSRPSIINLNPHKDLVFPISVGGFRFHVQVNSLLNKKNVHKCWIYNEKEIYMDSIRSKICWSDCDGLVRVQFRCDLAWGRLNHIAHLSPDHFVPLPVSNNDLAMYHTSYHIRNIDFDLPTPPPFRWFFLKGDFNNFLHCSKNIIIS